jgi:hypothetical protein
MHAQRPLVGLQWNFDDGGAGRIVCTQPSHFSDDCFAGYVQRGRLNAPLAPELNGWSKGTSSVLKRGHGALDFDIGVFPAPFDRNLRLVSQQKILVDPQLPAAGRWRRLIKLAAQIRWAIIPPKTIASPRIRTSMLGPSTQPRPNRRCGVNVICLLPEGAAQIDFRGFKLSNSPPRAFSELS